MTLPDATTPAAAALFAALYARELEKLRGGDPFTDNDNAAVMMGGGSLTHTNEFVLRRVAMFRALVELDASRSAVEAIAALTGFGPLVPAQQFLADAFDVPFTPPE